MIWTTEESFMHIHCTLRSEFVQKTTEIYDEQKNDIWFLARYFPSLEPGFVGTSTHVHLTTRHWSLTWGLLSSSISFPVTMIIYLFSPGFDPRLWVRLSHERFARAELAERVAMFQHIRGSLD